MSVDRTRSPRIDPRNSKNKKKSIISTTYNIYDDLTITKSFAANLIIWWNKCFDWRIKFTFKFIGLVIVVGMAAVAWYIVRHHQHHKHHWKYHRIVPTRQCNESTWIKLIIISNYIAINYNINPTIRSNHIETSNWSVQDNKTWFNSNSVT